jgi:quinol-cytochrome oxidoreductase complex cytochrome b subunit
LYTLLVGGSQPGAATLVRFYAWHVFGLALALIVVGAWHLFRVRRDGGITVPPPEARRSHERITRYELVRREGLAALVTTALLIVLALVRPAPLAPAIQEGIATAADGRAPWFFLWVQQLLRLGDPFLWGVLVPLAVLAWLAAIAYLLPAARPQELGEWFPPGNRAAQWSVGVISLAVVILTILALFQTGGP